ncbi:MAG: UDP-N-acetylmuramoyl-L-alanyl-D-glutamate--2,6-diaminopimelate ligase [Planctomycetota bacterium]|nr:UDP-N-acetylmuramoyl-L-alanyl-D-glutamate--2,6-diaminopimelate ligase [Planctomycetota bacterium]
MRLGDLCDGCLDVPARLGDLDVTGVACDSRQVCPGDLFVAVTGAAADGHLFASRAVEAGAVAVVGELRSVERLPEMPELEAAAGSAAGRIPLAGHSFARTLGVPYIRVEDSRLALGQLAGAFHRRPSHALRVVGVTGTKGKTSTTWLLEEILRRSGRKPALFGTVENRFASRVVPSKNTTPGALTLHGWLREHLDSGGTDAVIEVSSHAIVQQRTAGIRFVGGILTNVAPEHLDYHKTYEEYVEVKRSFFRSLSADAFSVLSREDRAAQRFARETPARVVWYGSDAQDGVEGLQISVDGMRFTWKGAVVRSRLLGYHNLLNMLAAMTAAECLGLPVRDIAAAVEEAQLPPGRLEEVPNDRDLRVVIDYAHTDGALDAVLRTLRPMTRGRLISIFGCGGDRDASKRPRMGRVAEQCSDQLILTSDNPRSELPQKILDDIREGLERPESAVMIEDRREAIALGIRMARAGDTVLIAGKGHEKYQEVNGQSLHFDDREVAREFLE